MKRETKLNAIRSGLVVIGALAFGYLTLQIVLKPFALVAQLHHQQQEERQQQESVPKESTLSHDSVFSRQKDTQDDEEDNWWELWDRRRRMAVAQVLCYVVYAIYILRAYYDRKCNDFEILSKKDRKRRARTWEMKLESIKEAVNDVTEAIQEGNAILEVAQQRTYSEREVYAELVKIGVERRIRYSAYTLLTQDPERVRAFFGYPVNERKDFLLQMMYGPVEDM